MLNLNHQTSPSGSHNKFVSFKDERTLFQDAVAIPDFFNDNLEDEKRQIKVFKDIPYTHEIIFTYQLLKLIFQTNEPEDKYYNKLTQICFTQEINLDQMCKHLHIPRIQSQQELEQMLDGFFSNLKEGKTNAMEGLKQNPIVTKIIAFMIKRALFEQNSSGDISQSCQAIETYAKLSNFFEIIMTCFGQCIRFDQTDTFIYLQNDNEVYLAFITQVSIYGDTFESQDTFDISSVKQLVSQIQITNHRTEQYNVEDSQNIDYQYSKSIERQKASKKSVGDASLRLSSLGNQENSISNNFEKNNCFQIQELPQTDTPYQSSCNHIPLKQSSQSDNKSAWGNKFKDNVKDCKQLLETNESNIWTSKRLEQVNLFTTEREVAEVQQVIYDKPLNVSNKNFYSNVKQIQSISEIITQVNLQPTPFNLWKKNEYTKYGYINNNITRQYTSSFILKQLDFQTRFTISKIKQNARRQRQSIKRLFLY